MDPRVNNFLVFMDICYLHEPFLVQKSATRVFIVNVDMMTVFDKSQVKL